MGAHAGVYAKSGTELKQRSPQMQSGYGCIRDDDGVSSMFWFDMDTDGGGWAVVAEQTMYKHGYPSNTIEKGTAGNKSELPTDDPTDVKDVRLTRWPKYTEYIIKNVVDLNGTATDSSLSEGWWRNTTGSFGEVEVDMMGFYLDKSDYQNGRASDAYVTYSSTAWGDSNSHYAYYGYRWYDTNSVTYNWWGQADLWGHLINSDLFRVASTVTGYGRTAGCGTGWANNACRLGKNNWVNRASIKHKGVFMVRR